MHVKATTQSLTGRNEYFRRFRSGYRPFVLGGAQYYGYDSLPPGYQQVVLNGITYYLFDGVYYQAYIYGGQTVYLVVPLDNAGLRAYPRRHPAIN